MNSIEFKETTLIQEDTGRTVDAVAVIREGRQVAVLPEADRASRALSLPLEEVQYIVRNFASIMGRQPTRDEKEFWRAVLDVRSRHP
ncbi:MAG: hypothetical protein Q8P59_00410 [Dehalococcoidia bacterium]|nr:hypothetical protein [Dehalococcoidia bacterium]